MVVASEGRVAVTTKTPFFAVAEALDPPENPLFSRWRAPGSGAGTVWATRPEVFSAGLLRENLQVVRMPVILPTCRYLKHWRIDNVLLDRARIHGANNRVLVLVRETRRQLEEE